MRTCTLKFKFDTPKFLLFCLYSFIFLFFQNDDDGTEKDGSQNDPFGELTGDDGSIDEYTLADMAATSTNLSLDQIMDTDLLIDDIKCETVIIFNKFPFDSSQFQ